MAPSGDIKKENLQNIYLRNTRRYFSSSMLLYMENADPEFILELLEIRATDIRLL